VPGFGPGRSTKGVIELLGGCAWGRTRREGRAEFGFALPIDVPEDD
jgi:hypothetical protein